MKKAWRTYFTCSHFAFIYLTPIDVAIHCILDVNRVILRIELESQQTATRWDRQNFLILRKSNLSEIIIKSSNFQVVGMSLYDTDYAFFQGFLPFFFFFFCDEITMCWGARYHRCDLFFCCVREHIGNLVLRLQCFDGTEAWEQIIVSLPYIYGKLISVIFRGLS